MKNKIAKIGMLASALFFSMSLLVHAQIQLPPFPDIPDTGESRCHTSASGTDNPYDKVSLCGNGCEVHSNAKPTGRKSRCKRSGNE